VKASVPRIAALSVVVAGRLDLKARCRVRLRGMTLGGRQCPVAFLSSIDPSVGDFIIWLSQQWRLIAYAMDQRR